MADMWAEEETGLWPPYLPGSLTAWQAGRGLAFPYL